MVYALPVPATPPAIVRMGDYVNPNPIFPRGRLVPRTSFITPRVVSPCDQSLQTLDVVDSTPVIVQQVPVFVDSGFSRFRHWHNRGLLSGLGLGGLLR